MQNNKLSKLRQKESQLVAQIQNLENKMNSEKRKADTRRKVLVGSVVLNCAEKGQINMDFLNELLNKNLTRKSDRKLFDALSEAQND